MLNLPSFGFGFVTGFATGFVSKQIASSASSSLRPALKSVVRTGYQAIGRSRETFAHLGESFEDLVAEAKIEADANESSRTNLDTTKRATASGTPHKQGQKAKKAQGVAT